MTDYVKAWQCIGCGRIEALQNWIGVCQDRKIHLVYAFEHEEALAQTQRARERADALEAVVRKLACTTPRNGEWGRSSRVLQDQACRATGTAAPVAADRPLPAGV